MSLSLYSSPQTAQNSSKMDIREELARYMERFASTLEDPILELLEQTTNPPPSPPFPAGPPAPVQPAADSLPGGFGGYTPLEASHPACVQQGPPMAAPPTMVPAHLNFQPGTVSQGQNLLYQRPRDGVQLYGCGSSAPPPNTPSPKKRKRCEQQNEDQPYIKKPPNAFMLFLKEQRPRVKAELNINGSASVNAVVGERWKSLTKDQQARYYKQAEEERMLHIQQHPEWSSRDNYGKKRRRVRASTCSTASASTPVNEAQQAEQPSVSVPVGGTFHLAQGNQDLPPSDALNFPASISMASSAGPIPPQTEVFFGHTGEDLLSLLEGSDSLVPASQLQEPVFPQSDSCTWHEISPDTPAEAPPSTLVASPAASSEPTTTLRYLTEFLVSLLRETDAD